MFLLWHFSASYIFAKKLKIWKEIEKPKNSARVEKQARAWCLLCVWSKDVFNTRHAAGETAAQVAEKTQINGNSRLRLSQAGEGNCSPAVIVAPSVDSQRDRESGSRCFFPKLASFCHPSGTQSSGSADAQALILMFTSYKHSIPGGSRAQEEERARAQRTKLHVLSIFP